jgi:hypothetical protein
MDENISSSSFRERRGIEARDSETFFVIATELYRRTRYVAAIRPAAPAPMTATS